MQLYLLHYRLRAPSTILSCLTLKKARQGDHMNMRITIVMMLVVMMNQIQVQASKIIYIYMCMCGMHQPSQYLH